jgi:hypothetical protein
VDWQTTITISKLDAAERQINTAVRLYFNDGDPVSIHTLSAAAFEILKDLDKKGPKTGTFYELVDQYVRPEERDTVMKTVKQAQNFFKHADQDPDATLDFILAEPEMFLLAACDKFRELSGTITAEIATFLTWWSIQNPGLLSPEATKLFSTIRFSEKFEPNQRREFFNRFIGHFAAGISKPIAT